MTDLGPGYGSGSGAVPTAINNSGQIGGNLVPSNDNTADEHAFIGSGGTYNDLGTLGGTGSYLLGLNNSGTAIGMSYNASGVMNAFVYSSSMQNIGTLDSLWTEADGINDSGVVVGESQIDSEGDFHAFLWSQATGIVDMNKLIDPASGWDLLDGSGINNAGDIVGTGVNPEGEQHAFLLTPVDTPEPASLALLLACTPFFLVRFLLRRIKP